VLGNSIPAVADLPTHAVYVKVIGVVVLDAEEVILVARFSVSPPTKTDGSYRRMTNEPVGDIEVVKVLLDNVVT